MLSKKYFHHFSVLFLFPSVFFLLLCVTDSSATFAQFEDLTPEEIYKDFPVDFFRSDHRDIENTLQKHQLPPKDFIEKISQKGFDLLCVGETHRERHRRILSDYIFKYLKMDRLFLETQSHQVSDLLNSVATEPEVTFLGAPFKGLMQIIEQTNSDLAVFGVEHNQQQRLRITQEAIALQSQYLSRDGFIAKNILSDWQQGMRHVALYGASHCSHINEGLGFGQPFYRMLQDSSWSQGKLLDNIKIVFLEDEPRLEAFLRRYSIGDNPVVLHSLSELDPKEYNYQAEILELFKTYNNLLVIPKSHP